jgi:peptidoglycan/LPS O-acetylase OafA/YrhL
VKQLEFLPRIELLRGVAARAVVGPHRPAALFAPLEFRPLRVYGRISSSFYLLQLLVIRLATRVSML